MKILHVIDSEGVYGAEVVVLNLMEEQRKLGFDPCLCSIGSKTVSEKDLERKAIKRGLKVKTFRFRNGPNVLGALRILSFAKHTKCDIVHSHGYKSNILLGFIPRVFRRIPLIITLHGWTSTKKLSKMKVYEWFDIKSLKHADAVVGVSETMLADPKLKKIDIMVVPNGVAIEESGLSSIPSDDPIRGFCKSGFVIGSIGRLSEEKGHRYLIDALAALMEEMCDVKLIIIGEGPQRQYLEDYANELGVTDRLLLPGYVENARLYLPLFNVFALPSLTEGLPITILEAMQAGATIVATEVGGVPALLGHGKAGVLVKPQDSKALADALKLIWQQPSISTMLSSKTKELLGSKYSSKTMAEKYGQIYNKVINSTRTPRN